MGGTEPGHKIGFTHRDRLGSIVTITDHLGNVVDNKTYDPFGKPKKGNLKRIDSLVNPTLRDIVEQSNVIPGINYSLYTSRGFTDHEHLDDAQLIHMNGRVYDYNLGRFLSVDPFIQAPSNSQSMNPYSYIMNNPLERVDPSGYTSTCSVSSCEKQNEQTSTSNTAGTTATTNGNKSTIAIVNVYRDNSANVCNDCHGETQKTGNTIAINYSNGDVDRFCFECSAGNETSGPVTGGTSGGIDTTISDALTGIGAVVGTAENVGSNLVWIGKNGQLKINTSNFHGNGSMGSKLGQISKAKEILKKIGVPLAILFAGVRPFEAAENIRQSGGSEKEVALEKIDAGLDVVMAGVAVLGGGYGFAASVIYGVADYASGGNLTKYINQNTLSPEQVKRNLYEGLSKEINIYERNVLDDFIRNYFPDNPDVAR